MNLQEFFFIVFLILFIAFIGTTLTVGLFLGLKGIQNKMNNLILAGFGFISTVIGFLGNIIFKFGGLFQEIFIFIGFVLCAVFTNMTFHRHRRKAPNIILLIIICLGLIQIINFTLNLTSGLNVYYLRVSLDVPYNLIVFNWLAYSSYSAYLVIKNHNIQPWIKVRYKLIAIFSFILSFNSIPEFFQPKGINWGDPSDLISLSVFGATAILVVAFSTCFAFAWMMPNYFKKFFNRNYQAPKEVEINEKELMEDLRNELRNKT